MPETKRPPESEWEEGWEGHERAQRRRLARLPLCVKIAWLEETQRVIEHLRRQRRLVGERETSAPGD